MNKKWLKKKATRKVYFFSGILLILLIIFFNSLEKENNNIIFDTVLDITAAPSKILARGRVISGDTAKDLLPKNEKDIKIQKLEQEIEDLRKELIKNKITKNELNQLDDLKRSLNYVEEDYEKKYIAASIVAKNDGNYYTSFTISAGKKDGVQKDGIVMTGKGLVGIVYEVSENYCKAVSILNSKASVSFELLKNKDYTGIASQNIHIDDDEDPYKYINGYMFDINYRVLPGDVVITSGLGLYPKGIPLGVIDKVVEDKSSLQNFVKIKPYVNLKRLEKVMILNPRNLD